MIPAGRVSEHRGHGKSDALGNDAFKRLTHAWRRSKRRSGVTTGRCLGLRVATCVFMLSGIKTTHDVKLLFDSTVEIVQLEGSDVIPAIGGFLFPH